MVAERGGGNLSDVELVASVRAGDDTAFEELYRRYQRRIRAFAHGRLRDRGRAEDVTQEAFLSALRRLRATDSEIAFKPWLFEIARNAAIDVHRRTSRTEEVPVDEDALLRASDRGRLAVALGPDAEVLTRERLELLSGAFHELPEVHHRALVMREFEGRSYREIGERLDLSRSAVESTLFRARRRLEHEYGELESGRHCESSRATIALIAEGVDPGSSRRRRFARHVRRCLACRRHARQLGVAPLPRFAGLRERAAALLPIPLLLRKRAVELSAEGASGGALTGAGAQVGSGLMERAASLLAAAALAGAGGAAIHGAGGADAPAKVGSGRATPAAQQVPAPPKGSAPAAALRAPARGSVRSDRAERARSRAHGRRDGWTPGRGGRRKAPGRGNSRQAPVPAGNGSTQPPSGLHLGGLAQPRELGLPNATGTVGSRLADETTAVVVRGGAGVKTVRESLGGSQGLLDGAGKRLHADTESFR